ncbi:MAG: alpha-ketoacid dehydrogenase subunit beta [Candidatus Nanohaloarchaea archaeon]|nr:alpha-ketoacid dehydrogenase subunit beta [Candidatus Nanohaloarchaea archaeon]
MSEELNIVEAVNHALDDAMAADDTVAVMGEDVGVDGGVFRATQGLLEEYGEERVMDTPLDEAGIIGAAVGMAAGGMKPVAEIQFSGFIVQAFHQLKQHAARMRTRTRDDINLPMVVRAPYGGGIRALEHHSESQEAIYARMGGIKVVIPSTPADTYGLLQEAIDDPDPVLFLEPKKSYRAFREEVPGDSDATIGEAAVRQEGSDVTVVSWGAMAREAQAAVQTAEQDHGIDAELIDLRTINPMDEQTVIDSVQKTGRLVVVAEEPKMAGIASELSALMAEENLLSLQAPVKRVTGFDVPFPLYQLEDYYLPNEERIVAKMKEAVEF